MDSVAPLERPLGEGAQPAGQLGPTDQPHDQRHARNDDADVRRRLQERRLGQFSRAHVLHALREITGTTQTLRARKTTAPQSTIMLPHLALDAPPPNPFLVRGGVEYAPRDHSAVDIPLPGRPVLDRRKDRSFVNPPPSRAFPQVVQSITAASSLFLERP